MKELKLLVVDLGKASNTKYVCFNKIAAYCCGDDFAKLMFIITDREGLNYPVDITSLITEGVVDVCKVQEYLISVKKDLEFKQYYRCTKTIDNTDNLLRQFSAVPDKPTLGLQPRKVWIQLRQYDIVKALHRQVEANEVLNEEWIEELLELVGEE